MPYFPHTDADRAAMLEAIGVERLEDLFEDVPEPARFAKFDLPAAMSELELERTLAELAQRNLDPDRFPCFLGAGAYRHFVPATVDYVLQRGELYTAYTPYQPEVSQGMLQAMFEYQTMVCRLTGMEVCNASHYDGATALAEAVLMALAAGGKGRHEVLLSPGVHPQYREVVRTYLRGTAASATGDAAAGLDALASRLGETTSALVVQSPDFFGGLADLRGLADVVHGAGAMLVVVTDPVALGLFEPPGAHGADIVVADGQGLGIPVSFGGPHLGVLATRKAHVRRLAGRLVGETADVDGIRGYVLTLGTREQHIRRERATSNICTNAGLMALAAAVHLATLGKSGLRRVAEICYHRAHYAASLAAELPGVMVNPQAPSKPFFKEFVLRLPAPVAQVNRSLLEDHGIVGGYDLGRDYAGLEDHMLVAVTEANPRSEIDRLVEGLAGAIA